jgi:hypothetical protein
MKRATERLLDELRRSRPKSRPTAASASRISEVRRLYLLATEASNDADLSAELVHGECEGPTREAAASSSVQRRACCVVCDTTEDAQALGSMLAAILPDREHRMLLPAGPDAPPAAPIEAGQIVTVVGLSHEQLLVLPGASDAAIVQVHRDLRSILAAKLEACRSATAPASNDERALRALLEVAGEENCLVYFVMHVLPPIAAVQESWLGSGLPRVACEALQASDRGAWDKLVTGLLGPGLSPETRAAIVALATSLSAKIADVSSEKTRNAEAGDLLARQTNLAPRVKAAFKSAFGAITVGAGYEKGLDW